MLSVCTSVKPPKPPPHNLRENRCVGREVNLASAPLPAADVAYTYADISKVRALLGYAPGVSVEEGIARLWRWYQVVVLGRA